jgi:hypothetical protein
MCIQPFSEIQSVQYNWIMAAGIWCILFSDCAFWGIGLKPHDCWDCRFESHWGHVCLPVLFGVCRARSGGLCDGLIICSEQSYCMCDIETLTVRWPRPNLGHCAAEKKLDSEQCVIVTKLVTSRKSDSETLQEQQSTNSWMKLVGDQTIRCTIHHGSSHLLLIDRKM